jgi:hypothetical protein
MTASREKGHPHCRGFTITLRHHTRCHSSRRVISSSRKTSTWQHTTLTRDRHPFPRGDSNPQSQQASGNRPTVYTARSFTCHINDSCDYLAYFPVSSVKEVCWEDLLPLCVCVCVCVCVRVCVTIATFEGTNFRETGHEFCTTGSHHYLNLFIVNNTK